MSKDELLQDTLDKLPPLDIMQTLVIKTLVDVAYEKLCPKSFVQHYIPVLYGDGIAISRRDIKLTTPEFCKDEACQCQQFKIYW